LWLVVSFFVVALLAPFGAAARPPQPSATLVHGPSFYAAPKTAAGPRLVVARLASAPVHAHPGNAYLLPGTIVNEGAAPARGPVVAHLLRAGSRPLAVGRTLVALAGRSSGAYAVRARLPRALPAGSYALVACVRRAGTNGALGCVTAQRHLRIGHAPRANSGRALAATAAACSSGAHSLSPFGAHVYPETGNGGYTSVHTDVFLTYDTEANLFLPGTHVVLTDVATQCLTDFSLDFERTSPNTKDGPDLTVASVSACGSRRAGFSTTRRRTWGSRGTER
jgi:hypothetical protein